VTDAEALATVRRLALAGSYRVSRHAQERAAERGVRVGDIRHGLINATAARWQADRATWRLESVDREGDGLTLAVVIEALVVVVTVF